MSPVASLSRTLTDGAHSSQLASHSFISIRGSTMMPGRLMLQHEYSYLSLHHKPGPGVQGPESRVCVNIGKLSQLATTPHSTWPVCVIYHRGGNSAPASSPKLAHCALRYTLHYGYWSCHHNGQFVLSIKWGGNSDPVSNTIRDRTLSILDFWKKSKQNEGALVHCEDFIRTDVV